MSHHTDGLRSNVTGAGWPKITQKNMSRIILMAPFHNIIWHNNCFQIFFTAFFNRFVADVVVVVVAVVTIIHFYGAHIRPR